MFVSKVIPSLPGSLISPSCKADTAQLRELRSTWTFGIECLVDFLAGQGVEQHLTESALTSGVCRAAQLVQGQPEEPPLMAVQMLAHQCQAYLLLDVAGSQHVSRAEALEVMWQAMHAHRQLQQECGAEVCGF